jgi:protocatechuate 3,4-dioxygenase beta subunit
VEGYFVMASPPGGPLAGLRGGGSSRQRTDADGEFSIDGLTPGQAYDLRLFGPTGPANGKSSVVAPASALQLVVPGKGRIAGRALDAASGEPITDFSVGYGPDTGGRGGPRILFRVVGESADSTGQAVPVHSDDGAFALDDVPAGTWRVTVSAEGYQTAHTAGVVVDEGATRSGVEVRLSKGATLKGRVLDATNGAPVANATVSLASSGGRSGPPALAGESNAGDATTDAGGEFELDGVATGRQTLHVSHPDYTDATQTVEIKDEGTTVEVRMTPGSAIGGVVLSDANQPVPEATVSLGQEGAAGFGFRGGGGGQSTVSDSSGQFSFDHLGAGRYSLEASLGSHTSSPVDVVVVAGQPQASVTLQLQLGVMIQGTVSGLPETSIAGTSVSANGADSYFQTTRVAAAGQFEFDNVPVGIVTLRATATDPSGSTRSVTKQVTATSDQPVMTADLVFDQGYTLSGSVTQAGQAVSGAMVFAALQGGGGRQASASSDDSGAYSLTGLQAGTYTVGAMSPTLGAATRQTIALSADQTLDIIFPDAKITGQVVDAQSKAPLASATVGIAAQDPDATPAFGQRMATADSNGQFSFSGLSEGGYTLTTSKPDYQIDTHSVSASESGDEAVTIELTRAAGIAVKVLDGLAGVPLSGAMVRVLDGSGAGAFGPAPITLDSSGGGEIPSLPPGAYTVIADSSGYAPTRLDGVNVPSATVVIPLTPGGAVLFQAGPRALAGGTATGTITTTAGAPALLSLFNVQGRFAISEANLQLRNVPPGGYVLTVPAIDFSQPFTVTEGGTTTVQLP